MYVNKRHVERAALDAERKHLEGLLKDRLNFFLVFASVFLLGSFRIPNPTVHRVTLLGGLGVSALFFLAVLRTHRIVERALRCLRSDNSHPYGALTKGMWFPWNANVSLLMIPVVLMLLFGYLALDPRAAPQPRTTDAPSDSILRNAARDTILNDRK